MLVCVIVALAVGFANGQDDCWVSGCQPNSWAVQGCPKDMSQKGQEACKTETEDGLKFKCCPLEATAAPEPTNAAPSIPCWWSGCQPFNWAVRGCPKNSTIEYDKKDCKDGQQFQCCEVPPEAIVDDSYKSNGIENYRDYVKFLLLKANNFSVVSERLECTSIDPQKDFLFSFANNEGIRICDLCPNLPLTKLQDVVINRIPIDESANVIFPQCFASCVKRNDCVAFSYDQIEKRCFIYNSTVGQYITQSNWTSVLVNQPVGIVQKWVYSRHSRITGTPLDTKQPSTSFLACLQECQAKVGCGQVSYTFSTNVCQLFDASRSAGFYELEYGSITALDIALTHNPESVTWRFRETVDLFDQQRKTGKVPDVQQDRKSSCTQPADKSLASFYASQCVTAGGLGCDRVSGCKTCYYPEVALAFRQDLTICEDSAIYSKQARATRLTACFSDCYRSPDCMIVDFDEKLLTCELSALSKFKKQAENKTRYFLEYPDKLNQTKNQLNGFTVLLQHELSKIAGSTSFYQEINSNNWNSCLQLCALNTRCSKASYSLSKKSCRLSSSAAQLVDKRSDDTNDFHVYIKKPNLLSAEIAFRRTPGWYLEPKDAIKSSEEACTDCGGAALKCLTNCLTTHKSFCGFVSVEYYSSKTICHYFSNALNGTLNPNAEREVFTLYFNANFDLPSLNALAVFQAEDMYSCFGKRAGQTQSSLKGFKDPFAPKSNDDQSVAATTTSIRLRRDIWGDIGNFFKGVGEGAKDFFVGIGNDIKDTAVNVADTFKNVFEGDFEAAKDSFLNIPIVKDVKEAGENVIKLGSSIIEGDWEGVKDAGLGLVSSDLLDFVPGIGKGIGTAGKILKGAAKKGGKDAKKEIGKDAKDAVDDKISKDRGRDKKDKDKDDKDKDEREKPESCKRREKRQANNNKRKQPGSQSCDDDSDDDDKDSDRCLRPTMNNVIESSLKDCHLRDLKKKCVYECEAGYDETPSGVTCTKPGKTRAAWSPKPKCEKAKCGVGLFPLIPVEVPPADLTLRMLGSTTAYVVLLDKKRKLPVWSAAVHDTLNKLFKTIRHKPFYEHPCLSSSEQGSTDDYEKTGWDQGHLSPANVMLFTEKAAMSSNLHINVAPQDVFTNRGYWSVIEAQVQCFSGRLSSLVVTGVCPDQIGKTRKVGGLEIPSCFWKMVCYEESGTTHVVGFIVENFKIGKDKTQRETRRSQLYKPVSQAHIKSKIGSYGAFDPWLMSAATVFKGRPGLPPVNPVKCSAAQAIVPREEQEWTDAIKMKTAKKKKKKKKASGRKKRQASSGREQRGCTEEEALRFAALYGLSTLSIDDIDDDDLVDPDEDEGGTDDPRGDGGSLVPAASCGKRVIGYYPSWGKNEFKYEQAQRLTHVVYAFLEMKADGTIVVGSPDPNNSPDPQEDAETSNQRLNQMLKVARAFAHLKVLFAIGGWENSQYFSAVASSAGGRLTLIASIIKNLDEWGFDGVDLDWEYPVTGGAHEGVPADKQNYVLLMKELREALDQHSSVTDNGKKYLISFAGAAGQWTLDPGFDLPGILKYADWANVMTYDFFGAWESKWGAYTGPPAPLFFGMPPRYSGKTNVDWTMKYYVCRSQMPHKINMGVPFYGRFWKNVGEPVDGKDGMWRTAAAVDGKFQGGYVGWRDIESEYLSKPGFEQFFHEKAKAPYAFNAGTKTYLGFENQKSLKFKAEYAAAKNLGGIMIWAIDQDDDDISMLETIYDASLCDNTDPKSIQHKCSPITDQRWWTAEDGEDKAGLCGRSAPLYKGYYPVCDPDDPGYSCCGAFGYCGFGDTFCGCPTCVDYGTNPEKILDEPTKPTVPVQWYFLNAPDGQRGRCGRKSPPLNGQSPTCNPDDKNAHCCSNGDFCGSGKGFCECDGCVDFAKNPNYRFKPKTWWDFTDKDAGKCGPKAPQINGKMAECDPDSQYYCCSDQGNCGKGTEFCDCKGCVNYKNK